MELEQSFEVEADLEQVWEMLIDVERVAPCLPGADVTSARDGVYEGAFTVKLGPTTAAYSGVLEMVEIDSASHRVRMRASGQDVRGQGSAEATITSSMSREGGVTRVLVATDLKLAGRLARFDRGGMIEDVSNRLMADFVACLESSLGPAGDQATAEVEAESQPVHGFRLLFSVVWGRIRRFFRRLFNRSD